MAFQILLIDDEAPHRLLLRRAVRRVVPDAEIRELESYAEWVSWKRSSHPENIALAIIDLHLGPEHGTSIIASIRGDPTLQHLPILCVSTSELAPDLYEAYRAGADIFLTKHMDPALLDDEVRCAVRFLLREMHR